MLKQPNPQGKGLIPVMESLLATRVRIDILPKSFLISKNLPLKNFP